MNNQEDANQNIQDAEALLDESGYTGTQVSPDDRIKASIAEALIGIGKSLQEVKKKIDEIKEVNKTK